MVPIEVDDETEITLQQPGPDPIQVTVVEFGVEYVNLKECRMVFSAANEILFALGSEKRGARRRLQGALGAPGILPVQ